MAQARKRWKSDLGDSLLQIALIISILRTDITQYLTDYSYYPEVQQALLGNSVGLQVVDNSHRAGLTYPAKYIDDTDEILSGLSRLARNSPVRYTISAYLVTENNSSPLVVQQASRSDNVTTELSRQVRPTFQPSMCFRFSNWVTFIR